MRCDYCERPLGLCECVGVVDCVAVDHPIYHEGEKSFWPAVEIPYGTLESEYPPVSTVITPYKDPGGAMYRMMRTMAEARAFAEFLNSDAIFEGVIPKQFLI